MPVYRAMRSSGRGAAGLGGIRAILVRPMSEEAKRFYERRGFVESPNDPMTLMIAVAGANRAFSSREEAASGAGCPSLPIVDGRRADGRQPREPPFPLLTTRSPR